MEEKYVLELTKEVNNNDSGTSFIKEEFEKLVMNMKDEKSTEIDWIPAKLLKNLGEDMHNLLYEIITKIMKHEIFLKNLSIADLLLWNYGM